MPKIVPGFAQAPATSRTDVAGAAYNTASRKSGDRSGAFDNLLSARRRESAPPSPAESERAEPASKARSAKSRDRADKRDAVDKASQRDSARTERRREAADPDDIETTDAATDSVKDAKPSKKIEKRDDAETDASISDENVDDVEGEATTPTAKDATPLDEEAGAPILDLEATDGVEKPEHADTEELLDPAAALIAAGLIEAPQAEVADAALEGEAGAADGPADPLAGITQNGSTGKTAAGVKALERPVEETEGDLGAEAGVDPSAAQASDGALDISGMTPTDGVEGLEPEVASAAAASPHAAAPSLPDSAALRALEGLGQQPPREIDSQKGPAALPPVAPEVQFADDNHPNIVSGVRGQLMPSGGTMHIRLDPPELGPLAVTVRLNNGVMEASFETSNDEAAKLLSHSLSALKTSLEAQGVSVERLNVHQAPKSEQASQNGNDRDQQQNQPRDPQQEHAARQEHQRKEALRRMWAKLRGVDDPLDMVA